MSPYRFCKIEITTSIRLMNDTWRHVTRKRGRQCGDPNTFFFRQLKKRTRYVILYVSFSLLLYYTLLDILRRLSWVAKNRNPIHDWAMVQCGRKPDQDTETACRTGRLRQGLADTKPRSVGTTVATTGRQCYSAHTNEKTSLWIARFQVTNSCSDMGRTNRFSKPCIHTGARVNVRIFTGTYGARRIL